jgi:ceramide glucosyltransferase
LGLPATPLSVYEPPVVLNMILGGVAFLSLGLVLWQWLGALRFPLHRRQPPADGLPSGITLLKPLKGCDLETQSCLRSWLAQEYAGKIQLLFGVASTEDPVCKIVQPLLQEFPGLDAELVICGPLRGANLKVSKLEQLEPMAKHEIIVISDADVRVPKDLLTQLVSALRDPAVGLVNCFYKLANPTTLAMQWEAIAINADFWSQVLQSQSLKPLDFALGAVMATRRHQLQQIGGFGALANCLADDYQLGNRIAGLGYRIAIAPVVVECWSAPMDWAAVWKHQLRWARTIRVCQPLPYFFSILSNATLWPLIWLSLNPSSEALGLALSCWLIRTVSGLHLQARLTRTQMRLSQSWLVPLKDLLQAILWLLAFLGNRVEWRGERMQLRRDGTLVKS